MHTGSMVLFSVTLLVCALLTLRIGGASFLLRVGGAVFTFVVLFISSFYLVSDSFTGRGIDESVVYHLEYGLAGAGFREYAAVIGGAVVLLIITISASAFVFFYLKRRSHTFVRSSQFVAISLLLLAVIINPGSKDAFGLYLSSSITSSTSVSATHERPPHYIEPDIASVSSPLNVVYIYLESLERTYLDETIFPGLLPGLKLLDSQSLSFTDIRQVYGTGWTIAGMTASQCGIPLVTASQGNSMSGMDSFLSGALCMGDILREQGYSLDYMGGASLEFAGKGNFYKTHGFTNVRGVDELILESGDPDYRSNWGIYDDTLFKQAKERFHELSETDRPFGLFMLTLDTHHPNGHPSAACDGLAYGDGENPILNAVHCADLLVTEFVKEITQSKYGENTLVIVASDHLAMRNTAFEQLQKGDRKNLFMALLPGNNIRKHIGRAASSIDIAPTVLSMAGFDVAGLGFGRDLMRDNSTVLEEYPSAGDFLKSHNRYLSTLWELPQFDQGLVADMRRRKVRFGKREFKMPALFVLNDSGQVENVLFEFSSSKKLKDYVVEMNSTQPFMWFDDCRNISVLGVEKDKVSKEDPNYCIAVGRSGAEKVHVEAFDGVKFLEEESIKRLISDAAVSMAQKHPQKEVNNVTPLPVKNITIGDAGVVVGRVRVRSSGFGQGPSYLQLFPQAAGTEKSSLLLTRGLSLVGITPEGHFTKLAHKDTCKPHQPVKDTVSISGTFSDVMGMNGNEFSTYLVVAHDSAKCDLSFDMGSLFKGLELNQWRHIGVRQPYIGVLTTDGDIYEALGSTEHPLKMDIEVLAPSKIATLVQ